jgi:hypothetical protein
MEPNENEHEHEACQCQVCSGQFKTVADIENWQKDNLKKHGFYMHYVPIDDEECIDAHTHGLKESFGHDDLQIVLPIPQSTASGVLWSAVERIRDGEQLQPGQRYERIIKSLPVELVWARDEVRDLIRILLPDEHGLLPGDYGCNEVYQRQAEVLGGIQKERKFDSH